ncbi:TlyA family RNA methyltransferase [Varibaculum timonense]|uniref:TlyA family RNA methyltransferase n=1 Tax=Varibaculum timonense TaxID=1964383 RepID=UPI0022E081AD|nr:TlyA family RNA methyltransferase [Varibaculum timonense]
MGRLRRLDRELVRRHLATSRSHASQIITAGRVSVDGRVISKPASQIDPAQAITVVKSSQVEYASRGGYKLAGVLDILGKDAPEIAGKRCLDAGASTGGFTDVLLRRGASSVVAVDVGYGQLRWELQQDRRVEVHDRTNIRYLDPQEIGEPAQLIVGDLSFISLKLVIPALVSASTLDAEYLLMVKPQFEVGREKLGAGGVVRDLEDHFRTVMGVILSASENGLGLKRVAASPLPGPSGNVEYFIYLGRGVAMPSNLKIKDMVKAAIAAGPAAKPGNNLDEQVKEETNE